MNHLGKTTEENAQKFCADNLTAILGSMSSQGLRRVGSRSSMEELETLRTLFATIAVGDSTQLSVMVQEETVLLPCIHRGSQRNTCCGSPSLWICRELKSDCVATQTDATKLRSMVATPEAAGVKVCGTCSRREDPKKTAADLWPALEQRIGGGSRVGFLSAAFMPIGGTETFHRSLLPRLRHVVDIAGFVATGFHGGDGSTLEVPYATGIAASRRLAAHCDVVVVWGITNLEAILPSNRPRVIAVHHADESNDWSHNTILKQLWLIDEIICVNERTATKLAAYGKPVHYVPNAIDPERITPSGKQSGLRAVHGIPSDSKIVLFGHRLSFEKRPQLAVEIARELPENWTVVIAGEGQERPAVESVSAGCNRVRVVGACDSLADWLSVSNCFLSLSKEEGFGLSIAEAMAAGIPTVSTHTGIAPGLATTLPTNSTTAEWADAIVSATALVKPEDILERYSVQRMVDAWSRVINESIVTAAASCS